MTLMTAPARLLLVSATAMLVGHFQLYQFSVIPNLYRPVTGWLTARIVASSAHNRNDTTEQASVSSEHRTSKFERQTANTVAIQFSLFSSLDFLGSSVGSLLLVPLTIRIPCRRGLCIVAAATSLNSLLPLVAYACDSYVALLAHRLLGGPLLGAGATMAALLIAEVAPLNWRGPLLAGQTIAAQLAAILATVLSTQYVLGTAGGWPYALAFGPASAAFALLILPFIPDSPRYLYLIRHDERACRRSIKFYQGEVNPNKLLAELRTEASLGVNRTNSVWKLMRQPGAVRALLVVGALAFTSPLLGPLAIANYLTFLLRSFDAPYAAATVLVTAVVMSGTVPALSGPYVVQHFGRRPPLLWSSSVVAICYAALAALQLVTAGGCIVVLATAVAVLLMSTWGCAYHYSALLAIYTEAFPQNLRLLGQCSARAVANMGQFVSVLTFLPLCRRCGVSGVLVGYTATTLIGTFIAYALAPETRGKTFEQTYQQYFVTSTTNTTNTEQLLIKPPVQISEENGRPQQQTYGAT